MTAISSFQAGGNSWAFAMAGSNQSSTGGLPNVQMTNPAAIMQGMGLIFAGLDMIDDGQINGSILQSMIDQSAQKPNNATANAMATAGNNSQNQQNQQQNQNPMIMMFMQMIMMMMQMIMMFMQGNNQQQNQSSATASASVIA